MTYLDSRKQKQFWNDFEVQIDGFTETYVVFVAKSISGKNDLLKISCRLGMPIGGYTYDSQTDSYCIEGVDFINLGSVPISHKLKMINGNWSVRIPISESLLFKNLNNLQKKDLLNFKANFPEDKFQCFFVQMINPN